MMWIEIATWAQGNNIQKHTNIMDAINSAANGYHVLCDSKNRVHAVGDNVCSTIRNNFGSCIDDTQELSEEFMEINFPERDVTWGDWQLLPAEKALIDAENNRLHVVGFGYFVMCDIVDGVAMLSDKTWLMNSEL